MSNMTAQHHPSVATRTAKPKDVANRQSKPVTPALSPGPAKVYRCACGGSCPRCKARAAAALSEPHASWERNAEHAAQQVIGGGCQACLAKSSYVKVSQPNAPAEIEADQIADKVMRMPIGEAGQGRSPNVSKGAENVASAPIGANTIHRKCDACEDDDEKVQRKALPSNSGISSQNPNHVNSVISSGGQALDPQTRSFFEPRMGYDLSSVRIHTGSAAGQSARSINARAYTLGSNIVFGSGEYKPESESGKQLIAHELAHTIQKEAQIYRQKHGGEPSDAGASPSGNCAPSPNCPADFCTPFPSRAAAEADRAANGVSLVGEASSHLIDGGTSEVSTLYQEFLNGGQPHRDLSSRLAAFFTRSHSTARTLRFLERELQRYFDSILSPGESRTVDIQTAIPTAIAAIGTTGNPNVMRFGDLMDTPGRIAGGVSRSQAACATGAVPSTVNDSRTAAGTAIGTKSGVGVSVASGITFTVTDSIDFCPGNCGGWVAQSLTVPLSRYEASGISGDIPFTVTFSAPVGASDSEE